MAGGTHPEHQGLASSEAARRLTEWGPNALPRGRHSLWRLAAQQFRSVLVYILLAAFALSIAIAVFERADEISAYIDAIVIGAILVLNFVFGFAQEYAAERSIDALRAMSAATALVRRDGTAQRVPAADLVPGDLVLLEAGDRVPADARIVRSAHLRVDESALTGEALDVPKAITEVDPDAPVTEQIGRVFSGSLVSRGSAEVVVESTGVHTEIGRLASAVHETEPPPTPLQARLGRLSRILGTVAVVLAAVIVVIGVFRELPILDVLLIGVSLAVSAVPEGLPAVVTVCFAIGVRQMARRNALTRRLDALETLGAVTLICADKTGTITENRMTVVRTWVTPEATEQLLAEIGASCTHATLPDTGEPTEIALLRWAEQVGVDGLPIDVEEVPFSSESRYMQTRHGARSFVKGAAEVVAELCGDAEIVRQAQELAEDGLRTLGAAVLEDGNWRTVGVWGMSDPPREGVAEAIVAARRAGVRTVMITGDSVKTATAVAAQVGLDHATVMTGAELEALTEEQRIERVPHIDVFARVEPLHKLEILQSLQSAGEIVAMTGDGVNDAPALRGAHVGIAMGQRGTDVARGAAAIVLADDHYASIVAAIREGRRIHDNIRRFVLYLLRANFDELFLILTAFVVGLPLPLLPVHILWINLMTDGLPALALATEAAEPDIMDRPPRPHTAGLLDGEWARLILSAFVGFVVAFSYFMLQTRAGVPIDEVRSGTLTLAVMFELLQAFSSRTQRPLWRSHPWKNRWMVGAAAFVVVAQLTLLYTPLGAAFHLVPLSAEDWMTIVPLAVGGITIVELAKARSRRG